MPYLHQLPLVEAYKKLYMLGSSNKKREASHDLDEAVAGLGGAIAESEGKRRQRAAIDKLKAQESARTQQYHDTVTRHAGDISGVGASQRGGAALAGTLASGGPQAYDSAIDRQAVSRGQALPSLPANPYRKALGEIAGEKAAEMAPVNGQYTPQGLEKADKEATLNANDQLYLRDMYQQNVGLGGSYNPYDPGY